MDFLDEHGAIRSTKDTFEGEKPAYCILSFERNRNPDYFWKPLTTVEEFDDAAAMIEVCGVKIAVPFRWSIMTCELDMAMFTSIEDCVGKSPILFSYNPLNGYMPDRLSMRIDNILPNYPFRIPKIEKNGLLVLPIRGAQTKRGNAQCLIVGETSNRFLEEFDMALLWD